jgi:hypothetical protein
MNEITRRFSIDIVADIGVAHNTHDLYQAFGGKKFLLVEANPAFRKHLEEHLHILRVTQRMNLLLKRKLLVF